MPQRRPARPTLAAVAASVVLLLGACSSDGGSDAADDPAPTTEGSPTTDAAETTTTAPEAEPLQLLVSNDDGYDAEGIDALVVGLQELEGVEITVVAPLEQQSGTGGKSTEGPLAVTDVELNSGFPATAVDGFPSDSIRVAMDEQGIEPDLVITGINEGQNVGPFVDISGTIGAARAAARRGVPALATSQGTGDTFDYEAAVPFILDWVTEHREAIEAGEEPVAVTNLNIPSCSTGELRELVEVEPDPTADGGLSLGPQDCASTVPFDAAAGDVTAFVNGFATISVVPGEPVDPPEVTPSE